MLQVSCTSSSVASNLISLLLTNVVDRMAVFAVSLSARLMMLTSIVISFSHYCIKFMSSASIFGNHAVPGLLIELDVEERMAKSQGSSKRWLLRIIIMVCKLKYLCLPFFVLQFGV